jgi:hypothetical protein
LEDTANNIHAGFNAHQPRLSGFDDLALMIDDLDVLRDCNQVSRGGRPQNRQVEKVFLQLMKGFLRMCLKSD